MNFTTADLAFVESLAREAGALLMHYQRAGFAVTHKGAIDLVTTADRESEQLIVRAIAARYPAHRIISEEDTTSQAPVVNDTPVWYIDPLDGTTGFVHHYPVFAVSIALYAAGQPQLAVVYDPLRAELFSALRGQGAQLNGRPIHVSQTATLIESLLTSGFPYDVQTTGRNIAGYQQLTLLSRGVRISGSSAIDLTWLACGRLDGYWEPEVKPWDAAAGALIVREAGGIVSDYRAQRWQPGEPSLVASNGALQAVLLKAIEAEGQ